MRLLSFSDVVGNTSTINLIKTSLKRNTLDNFIILSGVTGTGKSTTAEIVGLTVTCENPIDGEPCMECPNCKENIKALQTNGECSTSYLKKVNLGRVNSKKDVEELIKEIFVLQSPLGNSVYILEEVHALSAIPNGQTALLEVIERLSSNVYVIMCTTKPYSLLEELRDRAINYKFNRLTPEECKLLFDNTCKRLGITKLTKRVENLILRKAKGVPRVLVKMIEFVHKNEPSERELEEYFGFINTEVFSKLLSAMDLSLADTMNYVEGMVNSNTYDVLIEQLEDYILKALFYITGGISEDLTHYDKKTINSLLDAPKVFKMCKVFKNISVRDCDENDFRFMVLELYQILKGKKPVDIIKDNTAQATQQSMSAKSLANEIKKIEFSNQGQEMQPVDSDYLRRAFKPK